MAGHSQFKNIMHRKGKQDKVRSKVFGKLAREITVAAKLGQPDPAFNPRLRAAILEARAENMPKDNIERALAKSDGVEMETVTYEAYGPGGTALVIEAMTDNRNRTVQELKHLLSLHGGTLANPGAAMWAFSKNAEGKLEPMSPIELSDEDNQKMADLADALEEHDDVSEIYSSAA